MWCILLVAAALSVHTVKVSGERSPGGVVRVGSASVDTSLDRGTLDGLSDGALEQKAAADTVSSRQFLVHASSLDKVNGGVLQEKLGVSNVQFVPPTAFAISGSYALAAKARALDGVQWVSEMRPEWKRATFVKPAGAESQEKAHIRVTFVPPPTGSLSASELRALANTTVDECRQRGVADAEASRTSRQFAVLRVPGKDVETALSALADMPHVQHAEVRAQMRAHGMGPRGVGVAVGDMPQGV